MARVSTLVLISGVLGVLLLSAACGNYGGGAWTDSQETDYFLRGGELQDFAGADEVNTELREVSRDLLFGRDYYLGLHRHATDSIIEDYTLNSGYAYSLPAAPGENQPAYINNCYPGTGNEDGAIQLAGPQAVLSLALASDQEAFSNLMLVGTFDVATVQAMIEDVRRPLDMDTASTATAQIEWTLTGKQDGTPFTLSFGQFVRAHSRWYTVPI